MGMYASAHAGWGWHIEIPDDVDEWYDWIDDKIAKVDGVDWHSLICEGAFDKPPILLTLRCAICFEAGTAPERVPSAPNDGEVYTARDRLREVGINVEIADFGLWVGASYG